jgi:hypothetical protein
MLVQSGLGLIHVFKFGVQERWRCRETEQEEEAEVDEASESKRG